MNGDRLAFARNFFHSAYPHLRCLAMTATAPPKWRLIIEEVICMRGPLIVWEALVPRANLTFDVGVHCSLEVHCIFLIKHLQSGLLSDDNSDTRTGGHFRADSAAVAN